MEANNMSNEFDNPAESVVDLVIVLLLLKVLLNLKRRIQVLKLLKWLVQVNNIQLYTIISGENANYGKKTF